jgi:hypothetical protein
VTPVFWIDDPCGMGDGDALKNWILRGRCLFIEVGWLVRQIPPGLSMLTDYLWR